MSPTFPFDAVVGQDDAKLALRLAAADPRIGGVLLRGQKGSAKTTLARGLAAQLRGAPFVELPLGATEDRVVGTLDTHAALTTGEVRFQPGLLAAADGGVLYVDEINLLADHLVDLLLDVAVSGENVVERDGVSHRHPAHFVLVGSMNPEEGELRPQLLDRFGLCVEVKAPVDVDQRVEAVRRRLAFDAGTDDAPPEQQPAPVVTGHAAALPDDVLVAASRLALEVGAEGLRADLTLCRAAAALAGLDRRDQVALDDLRRVAPLVLAHRRRRGPFDPPVVPPDELQQALDDALDPPSGTDRNPSAPSGEDTTADPSEADDRDAADGDDGRGPSAGAGDRPLAVGSIRRPTVDAPRRQPAPRGRYVRDEPAGGGNALAVVPTVRSVAARRARDPHAGVERADLRSAVRERPVARTIVLCFDLSGSMGAPERAAAASGTALGLLTDAYERRDRVALVTFRGVGAEVVLAPTSSVEVARNRLGALATGGTTPLAAGLTEALGVAGRAGAGADDEALLVVLTDGRANGAPDELDRALQVAGAIRRARIGALVLDCETGGTRLGLSARLAEVMGARCVHVSDLDPESITRTIRSST